jgi:K+-transporting ATPase KdpF subunit
MDTIILSATSKTIEMNGFNGYITGAVIALFILAYLFYSLVKPEKF